MRAPVKRRFGVLLLCLLLTLSLAACKGEGQPPAESTTGTTPSTSATDPTDLDAMGDGEALTDEEIAAILEGLASGETFDASQYSAEERALIEQAAAAEGQQVTFGEDGSVHVVDEDGSMGQLGGDWPSNEFTAMIPTPSAGTLTAAAVEGGSFSAVLSGVTLDDAKAYAEEVKAKGFTTDPVTEEETLMGLEVYTYTATNAAGMTCEVGYTMSMLTIAVSPAA